jgi:hypothetical protein
MIFDTDPLCDMEKQLAIYYDNILSKFSISACVKLSIQSFLHIILVGSVTKGGQDD